MRFQVQSLISFSIASALIAPTVLASSNWQVPKGQGEPVSQVGRYTTTANTPTPAQRNPLLMQVQVAFPTAVVSIQDAMDYLLRYSGYRLADENTFSPAVKTMLAQPLPIVDRKLGSLSLQDALQLLANPQVFYLVSDPVNRLLSFRLRNQYRNQYKANWQNRQSSHEKRSQS